MQGTCQNLRAADLRDKYATTCRADINRAIWKHSERTIKEEVEASRKVGDRAEDNPRDRGYLKYMTLPDSRIWMRVRARSIKGVKVNNKRSYNNLSCRFCDDDTEESQEHLVVCRGGDFERRKLKMAKWEGKVTFWRRMTKKISDFGRGIR